MLAGAVRTLYYSHTKQIPIYTGFYFEENIEKTMLINLLTIAYLVIAVLIIGFILIQQGKGADAGASFGAGAAGTVFGSAGSANFLSRTTAILAIIFFSISIVIGNLNSHNIAPKSQFEDLSGVEQKQEIAPVKQENSDIPQ